MEFKVKNVVLIMISIKMSINKLFLYKMKHIFKK